MRKKEGKTNEVLLEKQIKKVFQILQGSSNNTIIAYEPIWAIGTGLIPSLRSHK